MRSFYDEAQAVEIGALRETRDTRRLDVPLPVDLYMARRDHAPARNWDRPEQEEDRR